VYVCRHSSLAEDRSEAACALSIISDSILKRAGVLASPPTIRSIPWTTEPLSLSLSLPCLIYFVRSIIAAAENALYISMQAAACPVAGTIDVMNNVDSGKPTSDHEHSNCRVPLDILVDYIISNCAECISDCCRFFRQQIESTLYFS
jgi:hypothetical protein